MDSGLGFFGFVPVDDRRNFCSSVLKVFPFTGALGVFPFVAVVCVGCVGCVDCVGCKPVGEALGGVVEGTAGFEADFRNENPGEDDGWSASAAFGSVVNPNVGFGALASCGFAGGVNWTRPDCFVPLDAFSVAAPGF